MESAMKQKFNKGQRQDAASSNDDDMPDRKIGMKSPYSRIWMDKKNAKKIIGQTSYRLQSAGEYCVKFFKNQRNMIRHYFIVLVAVLFTIVLFQNIESSQFEILFWVFNVPKIILFFAMLTIGFGAGYWQGNKKNQLSDRNPIAGDSK